jgi:hypothetical protein
MYSSLYFVIPLSLVLMCDICVPRRALPQIAAESKASAPPPAGFQAFSVPIDAQTEPRRREAANRRHCAVESLQGK